MYTRQQPPQRQVIIAGNNHAIKRNALHEFEKRPANVAHVAIAVHVLAVNVRDHRKNRRKLQKRPVAFVRLGNQILRLAEARVRAHRIHPPSDHNRRIEAACGQHSRDHRSRSRLPMHPGNRDAVLQPHQFRQHLSALDHRNMQPASFGNFGVINRDRGTGHDNIRTGNIASSVSFESRRPQSRKPLRNAHTSPSHSSRRRPMRCCTRTVVAPGCRSWRNIAGAARPWTG